MEKIVCSNGTMVNMGNYSSPIPYIGLYVAASNLVCLLLIFCDVLSGFRNRKFWFPCRYFSLNSITLTLISVATKIPVDLTTPMLSAQDQLSKLSGTVFICLSMVFMLPSLGSSGDFESYANITALSIFVVTVVVNIGIQIGTGLIYCFIVEHAIVMFCMFLLVIRFWTCAVAMNSLKGDYTDRNKHLIHNGEKNMLERLKVCFINGYQSCPQLQSCRKPYFGDVSAVCMTCSVLLLEAVFRSLVFKDLKYCGEVSDYGWSAWFVFVTQILTVVVVSMAIGCRGLIYISGVTDYIDDDIPDEIYAHFQYMFSLKNLPKAVERSFKWAIFIPFFYLDLFFVISSMTFALLIDKTVHKFRMHAGKDASMEKFITLLKVHGVELKEWVLKKGVEDINRWMEINKQNPPKHLIDLLTNVPPSQEPLTVGLHAATGSGVSCLSMLLLVEIAKVLTPTSLNASLIEVFDEVFGLIHFIDKNTCLASSKNRLRSLLAKVMWKFGLDFETFIGVNLPKPTNLMLQTDFELDQVHKVLQRFKKSFGTIVVTEEADHIINVICRRTYASQEELYHEIRRLFVDMLHVFLVQLPNAIFSHILESPQGRYEERVRFGMGLIWKFESLESHMRLGFSFPAGSGITSLSTSQTVSTEANIAPLMNIVFANV